MSIIFFAATAIMWFFIWRYRIHVNITWDDPRAKRKAGARPRRAVSPPAQPVQSGAGASEANDYVRDITSALRNQGCDREKAKAVAVKVAAAGGDFDTMLRRALSAAA